MGEITMDMSSKFILRSSLFVICLVFFFPAIVFSQVTVSGTVVDEETINTLPSVAVIIKNTTQGTVTDVNGNFTIANISQERFILVFQLIGYEKKEIPFSVKEGIPDTLDIYLKQTAIPLENVLIETQKKQEQTDTRTSVIMTDPRDVQKLPGASEDVMRSLQSMPGVLSVNDFSSQLVVRGGGPDQNLILMDGIEVFNPYRLYGVVSMFNPEIVDEITLYTGGFPVRYGDRLSSVLDVKMRDGMPARPSGGSDKYFHTQANMNTTNANVVTEGKFPFGVKGSWLLTGRRTYYDLILGPIMKSLELVDGPVQFPNFTDAQTRIVLYPFKKNKIVFNGILSRDKIDLTVNGTEESKSDSVDVNDFTRNNLAGVNWSFTVSDKVISSFIAAYYTNFGDLNFDGTGALRNNVNENNVLVPNPKDSINIASIRYVQNFEFSKWQFDEKLIFKSILAPKNDVEIGGGYDIMKMRIGFQLVANELARSLMKYASEQGWFGFPEQFDNKSSYYRYRIYAMYKWYADDNLTVEPGIRYDYYRLIDKYYISPRLNFSFAIDKLTTLRFGTGVFYQSPGYEKIIDGQTFYDLQNIDLKSLQAEKALHFIAGAEHWLNEKWNIRVETYYKDFDNLIVQKWGKLDTETPVPVLVNPDSINFPSGWNLVDSTRYGLLSLPVNDSRGIAYGIEFLLEKKNKNKEDKLNGWLSYAYAKAYRTRNGIKIPFAYDRTHTVNVVGNYRLGKNWEVGFTFRYGTGFPYTPPDPNQPLYPIVIKKFNIFNPDTFDYAIVTDPGNGSVEYLVNHGSEDNEYSERYPDYKRLDVRISKKKDFWHGKWEFYLDIINVLNWKNADHYDFVAVKNENDLSKPPTVQKAVTYMFPIIPTIGVNVKF